MHENSQTQKMLISIINEDRGLTSYNFVFVRQNLDNFGYAS